MKVFIDNDIAVKLARWGVLDRFYTHLVRQGNAEVFALKSLQYKFKLSDHKAAVNMVGSAIGVNQLTTFVGRVSPVKGINQAVSSALQNVPSIDAGEVTLFAAAANYDAILVDTGDKKALRALAPLARTDPLLANLLGKMSCLEQTVEYLCSRWTHAAVVSAVSTDADADKSVSQCFTTAEPAEIDVALAKKVSDLNRDCSPLLASTPFAWIS